jgi:hypothetical protein
MKLVIRDDDLNFFSTPADVERWYADVFAQQVPVGFSTIPFVKPTSDVYTNSRSHEDREYPISQNTELVSYVAKQSLMEILQHGCTHETIGGIYEYRRTNGLIEATRRGKEELEHAFGRPVSVFVPPHDWIGSHGILAVEASGMDVIRGRGTGLSNWILRWEYLVNFIRMLAFRFPSYSSVPPVYPHVLNFGKHREVCSYRLEDEDVFTGLAKLPADGVFVVVTHLHTYTEEKKRRLVELIEAARKRGAEFVRPSELFR